MTIHFYGPVNHDFFEGRDNASERATFQADLTKLAKGLYEALGTSLSPKAFLVSVRWYWSNNPERQPSVQYESGFCKFKSHGITDAVKSVSHTEPTTWSELSAYQYALQDSIHTHLNNADPNRTYFCSLPAVGNEYLHVICINYVKAAWDSLHRTKLSASTGAFSLPHATTLELLEVGTTGLCLPMPDSTHPWVPGTPPELLRRAGIRLVDSAMTTVWSTAPTGLFEEFDAVSAQRYEGAVSNGRILISGSGSPIVTFDPPIAIDRDNGRKVRKLLEMTSPNNGVSLGVEDGKITKLVSEPLVQGNVGVNFVGPHAWELAIGTSPIMRVADGRPQFPKPRLSPEYFKKRANDLFFRPDGDGAPTDKLWALIDEATKQGHGTLIVVADDAESEGQRLIAQAIGVVPDNLSPSGVLPLTSIDGAILLDPYGVCYAVGVILDGMAKKRKGDSGRGARYNSAVRYVSSARARKRLAVIISEDGMVDIVPKE